MKISKKGIDLIKSFEGCSLLSYQDSAGVWTIGFGHTSGVKSGQTITAQQAENYLQADLSVFEQGVEKYVKVKLNQNQFDALVSFSYNVGLGNLAKSDLLKKLNSGDYSGASAEFPLWIYAGGKVLNGLIRRRNEERALFDAKIEEEDDEMVENKQVWINGKIYSCDVILKEDRNFLAVSSLKQAGFNVGYNPDTKVPSLGNATDKLEITVDGDAKSVEGLNLNGFTYVKLRDFAQALGKTVDYDGAAKLIEING